MGRAYHCKNCNHVSGYHQDTGDYYGKCRISWCKCKCFEWIDKEYESYMEMWKRKKIKQALGEGK